MGDDKTKSEIETEREVTIKMILARLSQGAQWDAECIRTPPAETELGEDVSARSAENAHIDTIRSITLTSLHKFIERELRNVTAMDVALNALLKHNISAIRITESLDGQTYIGHGESFNSKIETLLELREHIAATRSIIFRLRELIINRKPKRQYDR